MHPCLQYPSGVFRRQMLTLIYRSTWCREERWTKGRMEREREQGLGTEYVPCHHIYAPCEADRINVMPVDKVGAERNGWMNHIHLERQREIERQRGLCVALQTIDYRILNIVLLDSPASH